MKFHIIYCILSLSVSFVFAQTPIDDLQRQNLEYLEAQEKNGYEFRSQIITEFDYAHASQDVNIKLDANYTYLIVVMGDSNIPDVGMAFKPSKTTTIESTDLDGATGTSYLLKPAQSARFKMTIEVGGLKESEKGFISYMVLRK